MFGVLGAVFASDVHVVSSVKLHPWLIRETLQCTARGWVISSVNNNHLSYQSRHNMRHLYTVQGHECLRGRRKGRGGGGGQGPLPPPTHTHTYTHTHVLSILWGKVLFVPSHTHTFHPTKNKNSLLALSLPQPLKSNLPPPLSPICAPFDYLPTRPPPPCLIDIIRLKLLFFCVAS